MDRDIYIQARVREAVAYLTEYGRNRRGYYLDAAQQALDDLAAEARAASMREVRHGSQQDAE